jgi:hypothetical protein
VIAEVMEGFLANKQATQKFNMVRFNLKMQSMWNSEAPVP